MNVLILGGGYIGNHLFNYLSHICDVEQITQKQVDYTYTKVDYDSIDFKSYLHNKRFDVAVNCSGYTGYPNVDGCEDEKWKCWEYNVTAPVKTAETLNLFKIPVIHVSSGCIYEGDHFFTEDDIPNLGLYTDHSSFYSKSKHAGELALEDIEGFIFRVRMPFCGTGHRKNILNKYLHYDNIVSFPNSFTCVYDLCKAVEHFCVHRNTLPQGIYNIVNNGILTGAQVIDFLREGGMRNRNWKVVPIEELDLKAVRSNCTLSGGKLKTKGRFDMPNVADSLKHCILRLNERTSNGRI
jgi:dTDP-4-dehydrorhamnose reductase